MDILAKIKGIKYNPFLCRKLGVFDYKDLEMALVSCASFILNINKENKVAISWWVSAKRTRFLMREFMILWDSLVKK